MMEEQHEDKDDYRTYRFSGNLSETEDAARYTAQSLLKDGFHLAWANVRTDHRFVVFHRQDAAK